jgi:saxitoxin biosynthesis operon SxtJ-like protein
MAQKKIRNPERSFGVSVGIVLLVIAALLVWRGRPLRAEIIGAIGAPLLLFGLVYPPILKWPSAWWWRFSRALGHVNARVLLTLVFSVVFVPLSIVWRLIGKDPLGRRRDRWPGWSPYPASTRDRMHYTRMF